MLQKSYAKNCYCWIFLFVCHSFIMRIQHNTLSICLLQQEGGTSDPDNEVSGWDESEPEVIACDSGEAASHHPTVSSCKWLIYVHLMLKLNALHTGYKIYHCFVTNHHVQDARIMTSHVEVLSALSSPYFCSFIVVWMHSLDTKDYCSLIFTCWHAIQWHPWKI
jgi:hypothetical protein